MPRRKRETPGARAVAGRSRTEACGRIPAARPCAASPVQAAERGGERPARWCGGRPPAPAAGPPGWLAVALHSGRQRRSSTRRALPPAPRWSPLLAVGRCGRQRRSSTHRALPPRARRSALTAAGRSGPRRRSWTRPALPSNPSPLRAVRRRPATSSRRSLIAAFLRFPPRQVPAGARARRAEAPSGRRPAADPLGSARARRPRGVLSPAPVTGCRFSRRRQSPSSATRDGGWSRPRRVRPRSAPPAGARRGSSHPTLGGRTP